MIKIRSTTLMIGFYVFLFLVLGGIYLQTRVWDNAHEKFGFCLDVIYNGVTDDSATIADCQKILADFHAERDKEDVERNQKFLDKIERNNLTVPGE